MSNHKVVISISYGDTSQPEYKKSTHMMSYDEVDLDASAAEKLAEQLIDIVCRLTEKKTNKHVFGVYKIEQPRQ